MLFAKASDRPPDEAQVLRWFGRREPDDDGGLRKVTHISVPDAPAAALLGSQPVWMWGLEHGVNEHGVAIGNERVWTVDDPRGAPAALIGMDLVRLGLERAASADAAVDVITTLLEAHGQGGTCEDGTDKPYWSSFVVVDGSGGWVLETSAASWVAQAVGDGAAVSSRLTLATGWQRSSPDVAPGDDWDRWRAPGIRPVSRTPGWRPPAPGCRAGRPPHRPRPPPCPATTAPVPGVRSARRGRCRAGAAGSRAGRTGRT